MKLVWITCGDDFGVGDVVRWTEPGNWHRVRGGRGRKIMDGSRTVTAQLEKNVRGGLILLRVIECTAKRGKFAAEVEAFEKGDEIRRKRGTIARGGAEKLVLPDAPKQKVTSRFLSGR